MKRLKLALFIGLPLLFAGSLCTMAIQIHFYVQEHVRELGLAHDFVFDKINKNGLIFKPNISNGFIKTTFDIHSLIFKDELVSYGITTNFKSTPTSASFGPGIIKSHQEMLELVERGLHDALFNIEFRETDKKSYMIERILDPKTDQVLLVFVHTYPKFKSKWSHVASKTYESENCELVFDRINSLDRRSEFANLFSEYPKPDLQYVQTETEIDTGFKSSDTLE